MRSVVATRHPAIMGQPILGTVELRPADDGGHRRDRDPLGLVDGLRRSRAAAADGKQGRVAPLRRVRADAVGEDSAEVGGVRRHPVQGRTAPGPMTSGRGDAEPIEAALQGVERLTLVGEPDEQVAHDGRLGFVQANARRVARPLGVQPVAVGRPRPGQQEAVLSGFAPAGPVWLAGAALVGSRANGGGIGDGVRVLRLRGGDGAAGAHGPGLPPVPLPRLREAVQRAQRWLAEPQLRAGGPRLAHDEALDGWCAQLVAAPEPKSSADGPSAHVTHPRIRD